MDTLLTESMVLISLLWLLLGKLSELRGISAENGAQLELIEYHALLCDGAARAYVEPPSQAVPWQQHIYVLSRIDFHTLRRHIRVGVERQWPNWLSQLDTSSHARQQWSP
jgi:hypothetical protein